MSNDVSTRAKIETIGKCRALAKLRDLTPNFLKKVTHMLHVYPYYFDFDIVICVMIRTFLDWTNMYTYIHSCLNPLHPTEGHHKS